MDLILFGRLSTRSQRALLRKRKKFGHPYYYVPKSPLLQRLVQETGMSLSEVVDQLAREREYLLKHSP